MLVILVTVFCLSLQKGLNKVIHFFIEDILSYSRKTVENLKKEILISLLLYLL